MGTVTALIAIIGIVLVLSVRPVYGLAVYVILSMWYPYGVGIISVGTIDFSAGRVVIIALFIKILSATNFIAKLKVIWLDKLIIILFVAELISGLTTIAPVKLLENRLGDFFDMALPYFAVRLIITNKQNYIILLKAICWSVALLAIFGIYESITGNNLLKLGRPLLVPDTRWTYFHRAQTTFRHTIYYGAFSAMVAAICAGLIKSVKERKSLYVFLVILMFLGAFFSMSSGALLVIIGSLLFMGFYKYRFYWKQAIVGIIIMCAVVEIISNRHFYDVLARFTFNSATAWYRGRLFEIVILEGGMSGHWVTGYGFADPGWGAMIDGNRTDIVNQYLLQLCKYGLLGFVPFCAVIITVLKQLFSGFWNITNDADRWLIWCLGAGLCGVLLTFNTVALFGVPMTILYMTFGLCVAMPSIVRKNNSMGFIDRSLPYR